MAFLSVLNSIRNGTERTSSRRALSPHRYLSHISAINNGDHTMIGSDPRRVGFTLDVTRRV